MPFSLSRLRLPDVEETLAFRAIDKVLKHDVILHSVVKRYNSYTGSAEDTQMPTVSTCPYLQIVPKPLTSRWECEGQHRMPISVVIRLATQGTDIDDLMNFWGCVRRALWPTNPARRAAVEAIINGAGIVRPTLKLSAFGIPLKDKDRDSAMLGAVGDLELLLFIDTP